jgi:hypothetical protein
MKYKIYFIGTDINPKNSNAIKFAEDGEIMRVACNFHYADWKERNKNEQI